MSRRRRRSISPTERTLELLVPGRSAAEGQPVVVPEHEEPVALSCVSLEVIADVPARESRSVDPMAKALFDLVRALPERHRLRLWQTANRILGTSGPRTGKRLSKALTAGIEAGVQYVNQHGTMCSRRVYDEWRSSDMPSASSIIGAAGSWSAFLVLLAERPDLDPAARGLMRLGTEFTDDELRAMIVWSARKAGYRLISFETDYRPQAQAQMRLPADQRDLLRFAVSRVPFLRFGNWQQACVSATSNLDLPMDPAPASELAGSGISGRSTGLRKVWSLHGARPSRRQLLRALRDAAKRYGKLGLTDVRLRAYCAEAKRDALKRGEAWSGITIRWVREEFGSVPDALLEAGVIDAAERDRRMAHVRRFTKAQLEDALWLVRERASRETFGAMRYGNVQEQLLGDGWILPSASAIRGRLGNGSFTSARELTFAKAPPASPGSSLPRRLSVELCVGPR